MAKFITTNIIVIILFVLAILNTDRIRFTLLGYSVLFAIYLVVNLMCYFFLLKKRIEA